MASAAWRRRAARSSPTPLVDITGDASSLLTLLENPFWRSRAVEQLTIGSARVCTAHRSLQIAPLQEVLPAVGQGTTARLLLPVQQLPKRPLVNFDIEADGKPCYLLKRGVIAEYESLYLYALALDEGVDVDDLTAQFLTAICEFTPSVWRKMRRRLPGRVWRARTMRRFLEQGLGGLTDFGEPTTKRARLRRRIQQREAIIEAIAGPWLREHVPFLIGRWAWVDRPTHDPLHIDRDTLRAWRREATSIGRQLRAALGEGRNPDSSADNPLLALPLLAEVGAVRTRADIERALSGLSSLVSRMAEQVDGRPSRSPMLRQLGEYGCRWDAFAWCEVPTDRPFVLTTTQEVPVKVGWLRSWSEQPVALNDALSNHVVLRLADENVELAAVEIRGIDGTRVLHTLATGVRRTREGFALYSSEPDRDPRVLVRTRLRVSRSIMLVSLTVLAITGLASVLTAVRAKDRTLTAADLAVLVVPTTFAASLLLTRERNSLARRLQFLTRTMIHLATYALWGLVAWAYFGNRIAG